MEVCLGGALSNLSGLLEGVERHQLLVTVIASVPWIFYRITYDRIDRGKLGMVLKQHLREETEIVLVLS